MHLPPSHLQSQIAPEPPADVRFVLRKDVMWDRPIFKAPPLRLSPPILDATTFAQEQRRLGLSLVER